MTAALFAAAAVLIAAAAIHELASVRPAANLGAARLELAERLGIPGRLEAAGLDGRVPPTVVLAAHPVGALFGAMVAQLAAPVAPGRLWIAVTVLLPAGGFVAPRAVLENLARRRISLAEAALPDALELLAANAEAGRAPAVAAGAVARAGTGPLDAELAAFAAEIEIGRPRIEALDALTRRLPSAPFAAFARSLERSARLGTPVAEQLREQAAALRTARARAVEDRAARAAPKIQLVVALVLVPSVLLLIAAALAANSHALLGGLA